MRCFLPPSVAPLLSGCTALAVAVRGDGRTYRLRAVRGPPGAVEAGGYVAEDRQGYYDAPFSTRRGVREVVHVPMAAMQPRWRGMSVSLPPLRSCEEVAALGFMATKDGGGPGDFALEVFGVWATTAD